MAEVRGVFTLKTVRLNKLENQWTNLNDVWIDQIPNTGYFGGGSFGSVSTVDKINYSTNTTSVVPSINISTPSQDAVSNSSFGYFIVGGSNIDKITYSTDTKTRIPIVGLANTVTYISATGNASNGYLAGGFVPAGGAYKSTITKITYASDTATDLTTATLSSSRSRIGAAGNSDSGYFAGGGFTSTSITDKITYSTDLRSTISATYLSVGRHNLSATGNSTNGYFAGGDGPSPSSSLVEKISYGTDTRNFYSGLIIGRSDLASTGNSFDGYFGSGSIEKISYTSNTTSIITNASLSVPRSDLSATGAKENGLPNLWRRFSDGSETNNPASIPQETPTLEIFGPPSSNTGYIGGGSIPGTPSPVVYSTMDKMDYASDTVTTPSSAALSLARWVLTATGNSTSGYFGGGQSPSDNGTSRMDKLDYSSDTTAYNPSTNLTTARYSLGSVGNESTGYFINGRNPATLFSIVDKLTYSSSSVQLIPSMSVRNKTTDGVGNQDFGYFSGGSPGSTRFSYTDKITYSSQTVTQLPSTADLSIPRIAAPTGNNVAGYFAGGYSPDISGPVSSTDKLTYSSDTMAAVPTASLSLTRSGSAATGNATSGYFGSGFAASIPGRVTIIDKLIYSSDTLSVIPGMYLSSANLSTAATSARTNGATSFIPTSVVV